MIKKRFLSFLTAAIIVLVSVLPVYATDTADVSSAGIFYYDDGSYTVVSEVYTTEAVASRTSYLRFGSREVTHYGSDGDIEWEYVLSATFSYEPGVSSICREASYDQTIYDDKWAFSDGDAYADDATAYGVGTYEKTVLFITVNTQVIDVSITCDTYGNLS